MDKRQIKRERGKPYLYEFINSNLICLVYEFLSYNDIYEGHIVLGERNNENSK